MKNNRFSINYSFRHSNTLLISLFFFLWIIPSEAQSLIDGFIDPPISARPKGYWVLVNGNYDLYQMSEELKEFKAKGMGGVDIWDVAGWVDENNVVPAGPPFMSEESVQAIAHGIREGHKLGLEMGLTISSSWNAGGSWVKPIDGVKALFDSKTIVNGPQKIKKELNFPEIPRKFKGDNDMLLDLDQNGIPKIFEEVGVLAYPVIDSLSSIKSKDVIDLSSHYKNGILKWEVPHGEWEIHRYVTTPTGQPLMRPSPNSNGLMIDHFDDKALSNFLQIFVDKLKPELGDLSDSGLKYFYTDSYEANSANWTFKFPIEFRNRNGYDLLPFLPVLSGKTVENENVSSRFLFDYKKTLSDLIIENHYALGKELSNNLGLGFIAEAGGPGPPIHNTPFESIKALGSLTIPRGEFWFDPGQTQDFIDGLQIIKGPASAAHLYNLPKVEAEAFTGTRLWQYGPGDLKQSADRALSEGLTGFIYHTTPHIPREAGEPGWVYNFGTIINTTRTWWPLSKSFHDYIARCSFLLQQGNFVADALFYYGDEAPNFEDPNYKNDLGFGFDYDVVNSDIILNRLDVENGYFTLPHGQKYKVLVLPNSNKMNPEVFEKIKTLVQKGGVIIGDSMSKSYSLNNHIINDKKVLQISDELWNGKNNIHGYGKGKVYERTHSIKSVLHAENIIEDVETSLENQNDKIDFIHRITNEYEIYFLHNKTLNNLNFQASFRVTNAIPEIWYPKNGTIKNQKIYKIDEKSTLLPISLQGEESIFVMFKKHQSEEHVVAIEKDGKTIFPNGTIEGKLDYINGSWLMNSTGNYQVKYSNNSVKKIKAFSEQNSLDISNDWMVKFPFEWVSKTNQKFSKLISWTNSQDAEVKYFSGIASYHKSFELTEEELGKKQIVQLDLGKVSKVARVYLNGKKVDDLWHGPFVLDVSEFLKIGQNNLVVEVANVMNNRLVGDALKPAVQKRTHTNITRAPNAWMTPLKDHELIESGLMGPVKINFMHLYDEK